MKFGKMLEAGNLVLTNVQFTDTYDVKKRPGRFVLFEEYDNVVVAGVTSNLKMEGIKLSRKEGAVKNSVIKLNYIFTVSKEMTSKVLFQLNARKKREVFEGLTKRLEGLRK